MPPTQRERALALRSDGLTIAEIAAEMSIARSTAGVLVCGVKAGPRSRPWRHPCGARTFGVSCQLDHGHDGPHRHEDENGITSWEPRYVAEMRRALEEANDEIAGLREYIRDIGSAWRGGDDAEIATAIGAATDAAGLSEQGDG